MISNLRITDVLIAGLLLASQAHAQNLELSDTGSRLDGVAALVNDGVVLLSELEDQTAMITQRLLAEGQQMPPQDLLQKQILENLVVNRIQLQRAEREGIIIPDELLNRALAEIAQRNGTTLSGLPELLARDGIEYGNFRREMRDQITMEQLRMRDVVSRISVTPRELEDYLDRERSTSFRNLRFEISHILISLPAATGPGDVTAAEEKVWDIYNQIQDGANFAQLALSYSNAESALQGGSMGWRDGEAIPTLFVDIVPNMEVGSTSEPIRSSSGFHLVHLDAVEGNEPTLENQVHARHILMKTDELLDNDIVQQKLSEVRQGILNGDDFGALAKAVSDDPGSAVDGGDLGWAGPGMYVGKFEEVLATLQPGEISEPFQTQYGWHIVEVLERRVHDTTDDVQRERAMLAIRDSKVAEETELWLRQIRDESFVEYRL